MVSGDGSEKKVGGKGIRIWPKSGLTELNCSLTSNEWVDAVNTVDVVDTGELVEARDRESEWRTGIRVS